jgi:hypothetical protein
MVAADEQLALRAIPIECEEYPGRRVGSASKPSPYCSDEGQRRSPAAPQVEVTDESNRIEQPGPEDVVCAACKRIVADQTVGVSSLEGPCEAPS